jgi:hypothetical protein
MLRWRFSALQPNDEPFEEKMKRLTATLREQMAEGRKLDIAIAANLKELWYYSSSVLSFPRFRGGRLCAGMMGTGRTVIRRGRVNRSDKSVRWIPQRENLEDSGYGR